MTMSTAQIRDLLLPGLHDVFGDYPDHPDEWTDIFERNASKLAYEREVEMRMMPLASLRAEGAATNYADMAEHAVYVYRHIQPALGFVITRNAIRDNQYASQFNPGKASLKTSMRQTKETYGAAVLNLAQDTTGAYYGGDGAPLLGSHPIYNGTVTNTAVVQAQLSETALNDAYVTMGNFKQASGLKVPTKPRKLIVALQNAWVAERLLHTTGRVGTADNDVNVLMRSVGAIPEGYRVNHYLTNVQGWYVLTDCPNGLKYFQRDPLESDIFVDFDTDNLKVKATERYSFGWSNWRGIYGCMP